MLAVTDIRVAENELRAMQSLASAVWTNAPPLLNSEATLGQLAWHYGRNRARSAARWKAVLIDDGEALAAWGWMNPSEEITLSATRKAVADTSLSWQAIPNRQDALALVLEWFDGSLGDVPRMTTARAHDNGARDVLRSHGYVEDTTAPWSMLNIRDLASLEPPRSPEGYRLTTMAALGDVSARVAAHRAAWESDLDVAVFGDVVSTWPYRGDLDVVAVAPDGSVACSVIAWIDAEGAVGELEPVGTVPAHRRLGLARAASTFALHLLRDAGAGHALVSCRGDDDYPVPRKLYGSIGFRPLAADVVYRKAGADS